MPVPDPPAGFSYFGYGNGLPYCIDDYFVTGETDEYSGVILEKVPPEGGWAVLQPPLRLFVGFNPSFLTVNQVYNLAYNIEEITLSNSFTLLGYETEFTVPTKYRFLSWGDRVVAFKASVEKFIKAGYPPDNAGILYGESLYRDQFGGDPYWDFIFNGCRTTNTPSLDNDGGAFEGTPIIALYDYYDVSWGAAAGFTPITRIVDKDDYTPTGFYLGGGLTFNAQEDSNNSFGGVSVSLGQGAPSPSSFGVQNIKSFNVTDPEGDYTLYATTQTAPNLRDESGNTVTIDSFKFREYT